MNLIDMYPFWPPESSGPAKDFANPVLPKEVQMNGILADSILLKVPQETVFRNTYLDQWQWNPIIVPTPQAPVQFPESILRADSLSAYAQMTIGGSNGMAEANKDLGNKGRQHIP